MPDWLQKLFEGWPMIRANLPLFVVIVLLIFGGVWWLVNWSYVSILASKNAQIEMQDRQLADYRSKLEGATPDQAKTRIEALETRLARVEPRRITNQQRDILIAALRQTRNFAISISGEASADSPQFAADLAAVFQAAGGWKINEATVMGIGNRPREGLAVIFPQGGQAPAEALLVMDAFRAAQIPFDVQEGHSPNANVEILACTRIVR